MHNLVNIDGLDGRRRHYMTRRSEAGGFVRIGEARYQLVAGYEYPDVWPRGLGGNELVMAWDFDEQSMKPKPKSEDVDADPKGQPKRAGNTGKIPQASSWAAYWATRYERTRKITQPSANREMLMLIIGLAVGAVMTGLAMWGGRH